MTNGESREALAQKILNDVWEQWANSNTANRVSHLELADADGKKFPVFECKSTPGLGRMLYHYVPGKIVESILAHCERIFDSKPERFGEHMAEVREDTIRNMATNTTLRLFTDLSDRIGDALQLTFDEALLVTEAALESSSAHTVGGVADARAAIENLVDICSEEQRKRLSDRVSKIPDTRVPTDTRPMPKITGGRLRIAIKQLGDQSNEGSVAYKLGVSTRALRDFVRKEGLKNWKEAQKHYQR